MPAFGYAVWRVVSGKCGTEAGVHTEADDRSIRLSSERLSATIDRVTGEITRLTPGEGGRSEGAPEPLSRFGDSRQGNVIEAHMEKPDRMSARVLGEIEEARPLETLEPAALVESGRRLRAPQRL